jgi:hypothetical protein
MPARHEEMPQLVYEDQNTEDEEKSDQRLGQLTTSDSQF